MGYHVALIFTENVSLRTWSENGLAVRDSLLYERLCAEGHEVTFVTYGKADDASYLPDGSRIRVLSRPPNISSTRFGRNIATIHGTELKRANLIKAHQIKGARYAAWAAWRLGKPFIARCGYLPSVFLREGGAAWGKRISGTMEEAFAFRCSAAALVPGPTECDTIRKRYRIPAEKIYLTPNWIDTERFLPAPIADGVRAKAAGMRRVCFVGRFVEQKQPLLLIEAMRGIAGAELLMIGGGELENKVHRKIAECGVKATVIGRVENERLPEFLQNSSVYVLPTRHEGGSPKTLLEAMACELPVVTTNAFGVDDVFTEGREGFKLAPDDVQGISGAIRKLLDEPELAREMGRRGRELVLRRYSIDKAVERELQIYETVASLRDHAGGG